MRDFFDRICNAITHLKFAVVGHLTFYAIANAQNVHSHTDQIAMLVWPELKLNRHKMRYL